MKQIMIPVGLFCPSQDSGDTCRSRGFERIFRNPPTIRVRPGSMNNQGRPSNLLARYRSSAPMRLKRAVAIALPICTLLFVIVAHMIAAPKQLEAGRRVDAPMLMQAREHDLLIALSDAETGLPAYALTPDPVLSSRYEAADARFPLLVRAVEQGTRTGATSTSDIALASQNAFAAPEREQTSNQRISPAAGILAIAAAVFGFLISEYLLNRDAAGRFSKASRALLRRERQLVAGNEDLALALNQAREASERKSRFLANMSHELRTPLNTIIGFTEVVHDKRAGGLNETQEEFLSSSLGSARHLLSLINDILDLEKIAAGHLVLIPESFDLHELVEVTVRELDLTAASKHVQISSQLDDSVRRVVLDRQKTRQILLNLMTNAVKFTQAGGRVTVRAFAAEGDRWAMEIEDTGIGISDEGQTRLFREFEQLQSTPSDRQQGTGLGLALTKRLVEAQGGTISVVSRVGVGSTFSVTLPDSGTLPNSATLPKELTPAASSQPAKDRDSRIVPIQEPGEELREANLKLEPGNAGARCE
jgi:signal transduction histidine kinase